MTNRMYTQEEVDELIREAKYKSSDHSYGCFVCGKTSKGSDKHLVLFCDADLGLCEIIRTLINCFRK